MGDLNIRRHPILTIGYAATVALLQTSCGSMGQGVTVRSLPETFVTQSDTATNLDSPAIWKGPGDTVWIIATGKASNMLHVFDAATGSPVRTVGKTGNGPGEMLRPNGITVVGNVVYVVERDNKRVQAFSLPSFTPLGTFGESVLEKPYGIAVVSNNQQSADPGTSGTYSIYVTDDFELPVDPAARMQAFTKRVKQFDVTVSDTRITASLVRTFGDTTAAGRLRVVESIYADALHNNLLVADEEALDIKVYDLQGTYTGKTIGKGLFRDQPEGIALWSCGSEGYWIATDQDKLKSRFYLFDRVTFEYLGGFSGNVTANTDGVALTQNRVGPYTDGVFYALQDDAAVSAMSWTGIANLLNLRAQCLVGPQVPAEASTIPAKPALVVFLAIDGMRADYFDRFKSHLNGGLAHIRNTSVFFPNGMQDHATTETAPGHATMLSGREPVHTGIVINDRGVVDSSERTLGNNRPGASPRRFVGTALYDWMRMQDTNTRALSVSRKDRAAILPIGQARTNVFWYSNGKFTTSTYYGRELPAWLNEWNSGFDAATFAGKAWELSLPDAQYPETDSLPFENDGADYVFPHRLPTDPAKVAKALEGLPLMDSLTLAVALRGVQSLELGKRGTTDLLSISLSSTDAVGHAFGPDSREIHDQIVKLDRWLGQFFEQLHKHIPPDRIILALTADHGMVSIPGYLRTQGIDAGEIDVQPVIRDIKTAYEARFQIPTGMEFDNGILFADTAALAVRGVNIDSLANSIAAKLKTMPNVFKVFTPKTLLAALPNDIEAERWRRSLHAGTQWLVCAVAKENYVFASGTVRGGSHGTMQPQSLRVPIAFIVPGTSPKTVNTVIRTVDIAPTLAALLGIRPLEPLDGTPVPDIGKR